MTRFLGFVLLIVSTTAFAHHSFAMFDMQKDLELHGVAKSFTWESPHTWLQLMVTNSSGTPVEWSIETGAPNVLYKRGFRPTSVQAGDGVTVVVHPLRDGRPGGSLVSAILRDGTKLEVGGGTGSRAVPK
jgi:hypothetical protein